MNDLEKKKDFDDYYVARMQLCKDHWLGQWVKRRWLINAKDRNDDEKLKFYDEMIKFYDDMIFNF